MAARARLGAQLARVALACGEGEGVNAYVRLPPSRHAAPSGPGSVAVSAGAPAGVNDRMLIVIETGFGVQRDLKGPLRPPHERTDGAVPKPFLSWCFAAHTLQGGRSAVQKEYRSRSSASASCRAHSGHQHQQQQWNGSCCLGTATLAAAAMAPLRASCCCRCISERCRRPITGCCRRRWT